MNTKRVPTPLWAVGLALWFLQSNASSNPLGPKSNTAKSPAGNLQSLAQERREIISKLLQTVEPITGQTKHSYFGARRDAIKILGEYRAESAAKLLCTNVSTRFAGYRLSDSILGAYPAVESLIQIGNPSVQEILRRMKPQLNTAPEYTERDLHLFAYVIRQVDGDEVGLFRLQLAAKDAQGTHKINLLNLIDIYKLNEGEVEIRRAIEVKSAA